MQNAFLPLDEPNNEQSSELQQLLNEIDSLQSQIQALRPLDAGRLERIEQRFRLEWNYHSNKIEGNSYTYGETKAFLLHGITAGGKPLKDSLEIKGHNTAILALTDFVRSGQPLTEAYVREINKQILGRDEYPHPALTAEGSSTTKVVVPGRYKQQPNHVQTSTGEIFHFAEPFEVSLKMRELLDWFEKECSSKTLRPVVIAALLHYGLVSTHPFDDGNGRVARILMNLALMKFGFPVVVVNTDDKGLYYQALGEADGGNLNAFVSYIAKLEIASQELWLRGAAGESLEDLDKEIALFKAQLREPAPVVQRYEQIESFYRNIVLPAFNELKRRLSGFNNLFTETETEVLVWLETSSSPSVILNTVSPDIDFERVASFELRFRWLKAKAPMPDVTSMGGDISFHISENHYIISSAGIRYPRRLLSEAITEDGIKKIADDLGNWFLTYLRSRATEGGML